MLCAILTLLLSSDTTLTRVNAVDDYMLVVQIKCYLKQLLSGLEHCHLRGVMHRDIKGSNLLVNNEGILKVADFGLANFTCSGHKQPLTSRVVTLWYRPPELLLGSTDYGPSVDLWSVGCVFAELLVGKPILQGRTEVVTISKGKNFHIMMHIRKLASLIKLPLCYKLKLTLLMYKGKNI